MAEIRQSSNRLASDILADALNSGKDFNAAPFLKSSEDMAKLLRDTEPEFGQEVGLYGGTDALRYETWLRASATIESAKTGRNMDDIIVAKLSEPGTDPRKVMAYLSSPYAMQLLAEARAGFAGAEAGGHRPAPIRPEPWQQRYALSRGGRSRCE